MVIRHAEIDTEFFTPRTYQQELLDKAKERNIIIPLGTGSGKTFIAIMLIKEMAAELRVPWEEGGKRAFFLVNKVALAIQQAGQIEDQTNLKVSAYHGMKDPDKWGEGRWTDEIKNSQVLVMTAQIFWDLLNHGFFNMERANLLIFDECHHACSNASSGHPYRKIMQRYREVDREKAPRVLGLTASVISANVNPDKLERKMEDLEAALSCQIVTTNNIVTAAQYGAKPKIGIIVCPDFNLTDSSVCKEAKQILEGADHFTEQAYFHPDFDINPTKPVLEAFRRTLAILRQLGPWCAWKVCQIWESKFRKLNKYSMTEQSQLFILLGETYIRAAKQILEPAVSGINSIEAFDSVIPGKVRKLLSILKQYKPESSADGSVDSDFSCIIFVEQRYVAYILKVLLKAVQRWDKENFGFLKLDFVIGYSSYNVGAEEEMALHRRQEEVLRKFRQKTLNLIISTSVLEEGIDVRQCNCVIRFDPPLEYRSYIQSKGRARKASSKFYILVESKERSKFLQLMLQFTKIEDILLKRSHCRDNPPAEELDVDEADSLVPAFEPPIKIKPDGTVPESRPRVSMSTAISLVNRYCAKLPSDMFTKLVPRCEMEDVEENGIRKVRAKLTLPINSPVKDPIFSLPMRNRKFAQMACALEACKQLYYEGELDDHLLPVGKESAVRMLNEMEDEGEIWPTDGRQRPGSTKRKQYYDRKIAYALTDALPVANSPCYVHVINLNLEAVADKVNNPRNRKIVNPALSSRLLGVVSSKPLPQIPAFPVYTRQGEVSVSFQTLPITLSLSPQQILQLAQFHGYLFSEILTLEKFSMEFNPESAESKVFIAPLHRDEDGSPIVDWGFVKSIVDGSTEEIVKPSESERESFQFDPEEFRDAIVTPWYRNMDHPHYYYVAEVCYDMSPETNFPDNEYSTFNEYFEKKYKIRICNQKQPLLDVDYTSSRLNLLTPRYVNKRGFPLRLANADKNPQNSIQKQILVPELVTIHPIPATMWNIIVVLPSILYRVNYLLLADELRAQVQVEGFGLDKGTVHDGYEWEPLSYGWEKNLEAHIAYQLSRLDRKVSYRVADGNERDTRTREQKELEESTDESRDYDEDNFEVGVWDPSVMHNSLEWHLSRPTPPIDFGGAGGDMAGLNIGSQPADLRADDFEEDEGNELIFDMEFGRHAMALEGRVRPDQENPIPPPNGILPPVPDANLFQPNRSIEPTGWESADVPPLSGEDFGGVLSLVSATPDFNAKALVKDIISDPNVRKTTGTAADTGFEKASTSGTDSISHNGAVESEGEGIYPQDAAKANTASYRHNNKIYQSLSDIIDDDVDRKNDEECLEFSDSASEVDDEIGAVATESSKKPRLELGHMRHIQVLEENSLPDCVGDSKPVYPTHDEVVENRDAQLPSENETAKLSFARINDNGSSLFKVSDDSVDPKPDEEVIKELGFSFQAPKPAPYGPNPSLLLQALTMSNANDGMNLERLETVGDSFLKYAVTSFLFNTDEGRRMHEGKLSFARSKLVSNYNLYRLGKRKEIGEIMVAAKFEPHDNWLPPGYATLETKTLNQEATEEEDLRVEKLLEGDDSIEEKRVENKEKSGWDEAIGIGTSQSGDAMVETVDLRLSGNPWPEEYSVLPYNILTQQSISDKSVADAVEALIGAYLLTHGPHGAMRFMEWLGLRVWDKNRELPNPIRGTEETLEAAKKEIGDLWKKQNFSNVETIIGYTFKNKAYLVQAFTHASYLYNRATDCYQRLEFLGDAVLDYMITRHLFEDKRAHSPGVLTDLRSALVNNTIFASLAVKYEFHKYFMLMCPPLDAVVQKFVNLYKAKAKTPNFDEELFLWTDEGTCEDEEDIEVPKALGDIFESVAGAIYLDSGCNLDTVWGVYYKLMKTQLEKCASNPPKSPIRELLEMEPDTAKFSKLERIVTSGKVRVTVEVYLKGRFTGMGRNYRIAKCTAAKRALRYLKSLQAQQQKKSDPKSFPVNPNVPDLPENHRTESTNLIDL